MQTTSKSRNKWAIGIPIALIVIVGSAMLTFWFLKFPLGGKKVPVTTIHVTHPSIEAPTANHRAQSTTPSQTGTKTNPWGSAIDAERGFVWVAEPGCEALPTCHSTFSTNIGKYSQADGSLIQNFPEPAGYSNPVFLATDANGDVWFTQPDSNALGKLSPKDQTWSQWKLKPGNTPFDLLIDKNGNIWFTDFDANKIGFFNPQTQKFVETTIPTAQSNPYGITMDRNGTIWFAENTLGIGQIGSFTPTASGTVLISEHAISLTQPHLIISDKDGNIWFSGAFSGSIGVYRPGDGTSSKYRVATIACTTVCTTHISGIAVDKKGNIWFTDSLRATLGYYVPATGAVHLQVLTKTDSHPHDGLNIDSNNTVWFTEQNNFALVMWPNATFHKSK
jgi:streptogramin lyase